MIVRLLGYFGLKEPKAIPARLARQIVLERELVIPADSDLLLNCRYVGIHSVEPGTELLRAARKLLKKFKNNDDFLERVKEARRVREAERLKKRQESKYPRRADQCEGCHQTASSMCDQGCCKHCCPGPCVFHTTRYPQLIQRRVR